MPIVCGIHPVLEALAAGSRTIERVVVTKGVRNKRILEVIKQAAEQHGLKLGDAMQPIRVALTGSTVSEPVNELLVVVGREPALDRLKAQ